MNTREKLELRIHSIKEGIIHINDKLDKLHVERKRLTRKIKSLTREIDNYETMDTKGKD